MTSDELWQAVSQELRETLTVKDYSEWFRPVAVVQRGGRSLTLAVPDRYFADYLQKEYGELIQNAIRRLTGGDLPLRIVVAPPPPPQQMSLAEACPDGAFGPPTPVGAGEVFEQYTFESFVVGPSNQFCHAACQAVAEQPGSCYNPLFLYGGVGLGKTHLLHAIGERIQRNDRARRVKYVTSESFLNDMIGATRSNRLHDFRSRYRNQCDVLLIDDIQFIAGKDRTQEEFFHTFNSLHGAGRQIVIASDRTPQELPAIEDRLRSRFQWGLIADIAPPEMETRVAILKTKAHAAAVALPDDVALLIATRVRTNVRHLEGALTRLQAYARLNGVAVTLPMAKDVLKDFFPDGGLVTTEAIQKAVAGTFSVRVSDLTGTRRHRAVALPRQVAMYLCRRLTQLSYPAIGQGFGGRDHSTVMTAVRKVEESLRDDPQLRQTVERLQRALES